MGSNTNISDSSKNNTAFLRCLGILLIINSHLDKFYPLPALGTGGTIGNSIFFMLSSYGLFLSWKNGGKNFFDWYGRRVLRIYPSVWVVILIIMLPIKVYFNDIQYENILSILGLFFYPPFWFLQAILVFYFIIYWIINDYNPRKLILAMCVTLTIYGIQYVSYIDLFTSRYLIDKAPYCLPLYFFVSLLGIIIAENKARIEYAGSRDLLFLLILLSILYGHKYFMAQNKFISLQFIQQILIPPISFYLFKISKSKFVLNTIMANKYSGELIQLIGALTLELYIVHSVMRTCFVKFAMPFPLNIIVFVGCSFIIATWVKKIAGIFRTRLYVYKFI